MFRQKNAQKMAEYHKNIKLKRLKDANDMNTSHMFRAGYQ